MHIFSAAMVKLTQALPGLPVHQGGSVSARSQTQTDPRRPPLRGDDGATGGALGTVGLSLPGEGWNSYDIESVEVPESAEIAGRKLSKATLEWEARKLLKTIPAGYEGEDRKILEKGRKALWSCCTKGVAHPLLVQRPGKEESHSPANHNVLGLFGCGTQYCPHCADIEAASRARDAQEVCERWSSAAPENRVLTLTLTIPNAPYASRKQMIQIVKGAWNRMLSGRGAEEFRKILEHVGWLRVMEIMHKVKIGTCHPHFHIAMFFKLLQELTPDEVMEFNLAVSQKIHALWEKNVRAFVFSQRKTNSKYAFWIDLEKDIVQNPYIEEIKYGENAGKTGRIKGGVVAELCENTEAFAKYIAKELAYTGAKLSRGGESVNWQGLLKLSYNGTKKGATAEERKLGEDAGKAFLEHIICTYHERNWEWSRGSDRKSFLTNIRETTEEPPKEEVKVPIIVGEGDVEDVAFSLKNDNTIYRVMDRADVNPEIIDIEKETSGLFRNVDKSEDRQAWLWKRFESEMKKAVERMQEGAQRKRLKKEEERKGNTVKRE